MSYQEQDDVCRQHSSLTTLPLNCERARPLGEYLIGHDSYQRQALSHNNPPPALGSSSGVLGANVKRRQIAQGKGRSRGSGGYQAHLQ